MSNFIQIHYLTSYPASLLNRDDVGFAKRIPFGGASRTRISSQCQKRHWRTFEGEHSLQQVDVPLSIRSRLTFDRFVLKPLLEDGHGDEIARATTEALMAEVLGESAKAKSARETTEDEVESVQIRTGQITVLGRAEVEFLLGEARAVCEGAPKNEKAARKAMKDRLSGEAGKNLKALQCAAGLDAALFGRMVTSDILSRGDAALHVAHAFTVHSEEAESDYFSAVDDLIGTEDDNQLGSGHIGNVELTSGLFYGYVVVDVPLLVSNLEGCPRKEWKEADRSIARDVIRRIVNLVATVSPGAKLGSTAPHAYAQCILVESGNSQPRTLANAFLRPVDTRPDLLSNTYAAADEHLRQLDAMYGKTTERRLSGLGNVDVLKEVCGSAPESLEVVSMWASAQMETD